ncbi:hypothetical protein F7R91_01630 [Streptomyces luteolifulvus]|uniref:Uncharacterized protein n=1 Tax=Streptomyces luteolifulvus TaxID=2615112 RepID=A0A6H9V5U7_9ACTN|nr:hypothetical protein [Streptomyces luteolifulvus]KAB1150706.1 hypothetical protein F7R91_01630 [Streptomyces luteolifulvus]
MKSSRAVGLYGGRGISPAARTVRTIQGVEDDTYVNRAVMHAKAVTAEHAIGEVSYLHAIGAQYKAANPEAAAAIDLIIGTTVTGIARSVSIFNAEID